MKFKNIIDKIVEVTDVVKVEFSDSEFPIFYVFETEIVLEFHDGFSEYVMATSDINHRTILNQDSLERISDVLKILNSNLNMLCKF